MIIKSKYVIYINHILDIIGKKTIDTIISQYKEDYCLTYENQVIMHNMNLFNKCNYWYKVDDKLQLKYDNKCEIIII